MKENSINIQAENTENSYNNSNCPICFGASVVHPVINGKVQFGKTVNCKCVEKELAEHKRQYLIKSCEFPPQTEHMTFQNFKLLSSLQTAFNIAKQVAAKPKQLAWLTFMGTNGVGKTHLAIAICRAWVNAGVPARYVFVPLLLDELREGFKSNGDESYYGKFEYYCNVPMLLLDDLGRESPTNWVQEKLETLVDYRLMHRLSLIITCNKSLDELSPVIASRLNRLDESKIININAEDYSLRK